MSDRLVLLSRLDYCHVVDLNTGLVRLVEGPTRLQLESHEQLEGEVRRKVRLKHHQYAIVVNPRQGDSYLEGEEELREGPALFALHPGEKVPAGPQEAHLLHEFEALLVRARRSGPHPLAPETLVEAGQRLLLKGPRRYVPQRHLEILAVLPCLHLAENEGVYVQRLDSGEVRLIQGPADFFLEPDEILWEKHLTPEELQALGFEPQTADKSEIRVLASAPRPGRKPHEALVIELEQQEVICLQDGDRVRVVAGPALVFAQPFERPRVLHLSGGLPVRPNVLRIARLNLGPDFIRDRLVVRTSDHASLSLDVTYRWQIVVDHQRPEKAFALRDFVGFVCQTLSAEIRQLAAAHPFDRFHGQAASLIRETVLGGQPLRRFPENGLEILGVDVEAITPQDNEIREKLSEAIKTNVDIYTRQIQQQAQLESERRLLEGQVINERQRRELLELELENQRFRVLETARGQAQAELLHVQAECEARALRGRAQAEAEKLMIEAVAQAMTEEGGLLYLELQRARVLRRTDKLVVPTDSRLRLTGPTA